jgi:hypothetical protein
LLAVIHNALAAGEGVFASVGSQRDTGSVVFMEKGKI